MASANGILSYCRVTETSTVITPVNGGGNNTVVTNSNYHFKSSTIYNSPDVTAATGVSYIAPDAWTGSEPLISVAQLIESGKLVRLYALVKPSDTTKPNKRVAIFLTPGKVESAKVSGGTNTLIGKTLNTYRKGGTQPIGTVLKLGARTSDVFK